MSSTEAQSTRYELFVRHIDFPAVQRAGQAIVKVINLALVERLHSWLEVRIAGVHVNKTEEV